MGKTTLARRLEAQTGALRFTPDEWLLPLLGPTAPEAARDVLEGRFIWLAHQALRGALSVILDFGFYSPEERYAVRAIAELAGADSEVHSLVLPEAERRARVERRWLEDSSSTFELSDKDQDRSLAAFVPPTTAELSGGPVPSPPPPYESWPAWASDRWPTLPRLDVS